MSSRADPVFRIIMSLARSRRRSFVYARCQIVKIVRFQDVTPPIIRPIAGWCPRRQPPIGHLNQFTADAHMTDLVAHPGPDWVVAEMPPGYQTRLPDIQRRIPDLHEMCRFARWLGALVLQLGESALDAFAALKFETALVTGTSS